MNITKASKDKRILKILFPILGSILVIAIIFIFSALIWIGLSGFKFLDFFIVLQLLLKKMGAYSTLLAAIVATVFFQSYTTSKSEDKDIELKIQNIGHYTLAFPREDDGYNEEFKGDKIVLEICTSDDFKIEECEQMKKNNVTHLFVKFLTSKNTSSNLKNMMAFSEDFFDKNKKQIIANYFSYCEKIKYPSPLYCSAKPTSELKNNIESDRNRYFNLFVKANSNECIKTVWISAITDEGVLLFIKVKLKIQLQMINEKEGYYIQLLQQTSYFKHNNELYTLYR